MTLGSAPRADSVVIALHYQNENCHPDGKIKVGIADGAPWREERLANARRLFAGARKAGIPIVHVRLAVRDDMAEVIQNTPIFRQWVELGAWRDGTWGVEFIDGLGPVDGEFVVTHTRNNGFYGCNLDEVVRKMGATRLFCCGVSTAYAVESTVRHATDVGFDTWVVGDACSTGTAAQHEGALAAMQLLATVATVDEVLSEIGGQG
ncbi:MAG: cysteine hydrolase [Pseudomonadota bacterium]